MRGGLAMAIIGGFMLAAAPALAAPESCARDFEPVMKKRQGYIDQITGFKRKKPTAPQACAVFRGLAENNDKVVEMMTAQKDWCQIPDEALANAKKEQAQIIQTRGNVCGAAAKQAQMIKQMQRRAAQQQGARQPAAGSGVRLPQGAL